MLTKPISHTYKPPFDVVIPVETLSALVWPRCGQRRRRRRWHYSVGSRFSLGQLVRVGTKLNWGEGGSGLGLEFELETRELNE